MNRIISALVFTIITLSVSAQHSIQSTVFDAKNGLPLEMATVRLLSSKDSSLVKGCQTDLKGAFMLDKIKDGNYILLVSSVGYNEQSRNITMEKKDILLKSFQMIENVKVLKEVDVKGTAAQLVVKGDTVEYNATAFKTQENAVVEDLLKKLPGVEISTDGKITVNGQEVKKIRVDGKKFFGDDVEMTTKNIPADMIDKIQVLEQKSDMALLTGFEDNDTERIINLTTKSNRKKGTFGTISAGAGIDTNNDFRYDGNANINLMNNDVQTSVVAGANNLNTTRSSRGRFGGAGQNSGITETQNIGLNNNTIVNPKLKFGGNVTFNHSNNTGETKTVKDSYLKESVYNDSTYTRTTNESYNTNLTLELEWKIDSLNTLVFQPNISHSLTNTTSSRDFLYQTNNDTTSWGNSNNNGNGSSLSGGFNLIYSRKFLSKKGRTFTANLQSGFSDSNNESFNYSLKNTISNQRIVDQFTTNNSNRYNYSIRMSYVEPLWNNKNLIEAALSIRNTTTTSEKLQYNTTDPNAHLLLDRDAYISEANFDSAYSNNFKNIFYSEALELNYRFYQQNFNLMLGIKGEPSQTINERIYKNGQIIANNYGVFNFSPTGRFQYNFGKKEFARIDYRGQTEQPSITQMQPVKNNSNLMNETVGNPELNPAYSQNLRLFYSVFNDKTFSSFSTMIGGTATKDALVSNSIYDPTGKQYNQTVNAKVIPYSVEGNVMYNTPIIQKRLHFNTSTQLGYSTRYGYTSKGVATDDIDIENLMLGDLSETRRLSGSEQLSLTFTNDFLEIGTRGNLRYSDSKNNLSATQNTTWDWTGSGNVVVRLPYSINISSDINYTTHEGYANFDQNELIWNASIDKTLFKGKGTIAFKATDILRQRLNIRQIIGDNYIQYSSYNTLPAYFLVTFSYKINKFNGNTSKADFNNRDNRFGPGMRGGEGGGEMRMRNFGGEGGGFDRGF